METNEKTETDDECAIVSSKQQLLIRFRVGITSLGRSGFPLGKASEDSQIMKCIVKGVSRERERGSVEVRTPKKAHLGISISRKRSFMEGSFSSGLGMRKFLWSKIQGRRENTWHWEVSGKGKPRRKWKQKYLRHSRREARPNGPSPRGFHSLAITKRSCRPCAANWEV